MADQTVPLQGGVPVSEANPLQSELSDGTDTLGINSDGSINAYVTDGTNVLAPNSDGSVAVGDGTEKLLINTDGSITSKISDGTHTLDMDANGRIGVIAKDEFTEIARGNVSGSRQVKRTGCNESVAGTKVDVSLTPPVLPASAASCNVKSASGDDDVGGTGCLTVRVYGLDDTGALASEVVTMTGAVDVATTTLFSRVFGVEALTFGAGGAVAGAITVKDSTNTYTYATLPVAAMATEDCMYTVPTGASGYLLGYDAGSGSAGAGYVLLRIEATMDPVTGTATAGVFRPLCSLVLSNNASTSVQLASPIKLPAGVDVKATAKRINGASAFAVSCTMDLVIE